MMLRSTTASLILFLAPCFVLTAHDNAAQADGLFHHCPKNIFYKPKHPRIKYKSICPKPICPCCPLPNFGYFPTCWQMWPFPPDYSHCPTPQTIAIAPNAPNKPETQKPAPALEQLPAPQLLPTSARTSLR